MRLHLKAFVAAGAIAVAFSATLTHAQFWNGSVDNDWHTGANWDGGAVPAFGNNAVLASDIHTNTIANITTANTESDAMFVGLEVNGSVVDGTVNHSAFTGTYTNGMFIGRGGATGTYNQTLGSTVNTSLVLVGTADGGAAVPAGDGNYNLSDTSVLNASNFVIVAEVPGTTGTMTLNGSSTVNANLGANPSVIVGRQGSTGTLNIHDTATLNAADRIHVGDFEGAKGTINQDGNSVVNSAVTWLGVFDAGGQGTEGTYNLSGAAVLNSFNVIVGRDGGKGTLSVADTALVDVNDGLIIGDFNGGNGTVNQSGGTVDVGQWVGVGNAAGTTGAYNLSGGTLNVGTRITDDLKVGDAGVGTFVQSGASTVNVHRDLLVSAQGSSAGSTYTQDGGDVNVGVTGGWMIVGRDNGSNGTYNLNSGSINALGRLVVGANGGSTGALNITGGTVTTGDSLMAGRHGSGSVVQSAGVVNTQNVFIGGDPGDAAVAVGNSAYVITGGNLNASGDIQIGINPNAGTPFAVGMNVAGDASVSASGNLQVSSGGNAHFLVSGDLAVVNISGDLDANSANTAQLIWGSGANGVVDINVGVGAADPSLVDVDVSGAELLIQLVNGDPGTGLFTVAQTTPGDLLLIDNQGTNPVIGELTYNPVFGTLQALPEGTLLNDDGPLQLLNGLSYSITYQGGDGNDVVLLLQVPEPTSIAMLAFGSVLLGGFRRRR